MPARTFTGFRVMRRFGVALLALACLSPTTFQWPALPPLPVMLGLVPEPVPVRSPDPLFEGVDAASAAFAASTQAGGGTGQPGQAPVTPAGSRPPPPAPGGAGAGAQGAPLPPLPADQVPRGRYHRVEPGETAASIAAVYGVANQWVVYDANPILTHPHRPPVGAWLYIPHPALQPQPRPRPGQPGWTGRPSNTVMVDSVWLQLAACESSGNWAIDTGNGYFGGLQFTLSSWRSVGGAGHPHEAHPMEQIARADYLQRIQGWEAWPLCSEKLGLLPPGVGQAIVDRARARQRGDARARATERPTQTP